MQEGLNYWNYCLANAERSTLPHWDPEKDFWEIKIILLSWNKTALQGIKLALCQHDLLRERERQMSSVHTWTWSSKKKRKKERKERPRQLPCRSENHLLKEVRWERAHTSPPQTTFSHGQEERKKIVSPLSLDNPQKSRQKCTRGWKWRRIDDSGFFLKDAKQLPSGPFLRLQLGSKWLNTVNIRRWSVTIRNEGPPGSTITMRRKI